MDAGVMRASDMPPEEQADYYARLAETLERADEGLRASRERDIPTELWQPPEPQQPPSVPTPRPKPVPATAMSAADSAPWNAAMEKRLDVFAKGIGEAVGKIAAQERVRTEKKIAEAEGRLSDRIAASDQAVVDLLLQLEARVAALEEAQQQRAQASSRPRLVGGSSDAA